MIMKELTNDEKMSFLAEVNNLFAAKIYWSWEKKLSQMDKLKRFCTYCDSYIYKA